MEFLLSLPLLFGAIIIALIIAIAILVELENATWASVLVTAAIIFVGFTYKNEAWEFISSNPVNILKYTGLYILAGVVWSLIKWKLYISKHSRLFKSIKESFILKYGEIGSHWSKWIDYLNDKVSLPNFQSFKQSDEPEDVIRKITIDAGYKKGVIISWISYWPMSLAATFLNDPFRRFFSWLFDVLSGVYSRMAKNSVQGLDEGMVKFESDEQKK